jgi:hypothetical protein
VGDNRIKIAATGNGISVAFNAFGTYLGTRNLIYAWHADDWSTIGSEIFMLPVGVLIGLYFLRKMLP